MGAPLIIVGDDLVNRSFELSGPMTWTDVATGVLTQDKTGSPAALDGDATGKLVTLANGDGFEQRVYPDVKTLSSQPWRFHIFGRTASGTETMDLSILYYDTSNTLLATDTASVTLSSGSWQGVGVNGTIPTGSVYYIIARITTSTGAGTTYWDQAFLGRRVDFEHTWAQFNAPEHAVMTASESEAGRFEFRRLRAMLDYTIETYPEDQVDTQMTLWFDLVSRGLTWHALLDRTDASEGIYTDIYTPDPVLDRTRLPGSHFEYRLSGAKLGST